jgi:hypothetical protein
MCYGIRKYNKIYTRNIILNKNIILQYTYGFIKN